MKPKNKKFHYLAFSITSFTVIIVTALSNLSFKKQPKAENINNNFKKQEDYKYIVKEDSGKIKVFENGKEEPLATVDREIEYLPEYDKKILKNGIYLKNNEELNKTLEDYED